MRETIVVYQIHLLNNSSGRVSEALEGFKREIRKRDEKKEEKDWPSSRFYA